MRRARVILISALMLSGFVIKGRSQVFIGSTEVDTSTVITGLDTPWEILWGPDDHIWFTERYGRISRVDPETGQLTVLLTIPDVSEINEGGLLGMVLHPDFLNHPYVYVVYTYENSGTREKLVRYNYSEGKLLSPLTMLDGIRGSTNHDGARLLIDGDQKLFLTTGDALNTSSSQDITSLNGKVLRMNLDGSIPGDNPFPGSYVWSWGHRNAQGLVISPLGIMYSSEHGPSSDDEINIIEKGRNYGWPEVMGYCSEADELQFCADSNVMEPIMAWTPTLAVAGTDFYSHPAIPEWQNKLLITSLKASGLTALGLSPDGRSVTSEDMYFQYWFGRLRDLCISPDGRVFLAVSNRDGRGNVRPGDDRIVEISANQNTTTGILPGRVSLSSGLFPDVSAYPNPVSGNEVQLHYRLEAEAQLRVYTLDGKEISRYMLTPGESPRNIHLPGPGGLYNLVITGRDGTRLIRVLKL